jgi:hypothetical protein
LTKEVSDFVAQVMCEVGALTLYSAIRRSTVQEGKVQWERVKAKRQIMTNSAARINFHALATLRKWPSVKKERVTTSLYVGPYLVLDGTLDECIREFLAKPVSQHHLYEIHTAPQGDLVSAVLSAKHILEIARLRDFL